MRATNGLRGLGAARLLAVLVGSLAMVYVIAAL